MKRSSLTLTSVWSALRTIAPESKYSFRLAFKEYKEFYHHLVRFNGKACAIKTLKEVHQVAKRYLCGVHVPGTYVASTHWLRTCFVTGVPIRLRCLDRMLRSRHRDVRLVAISVSAAYQVFYSPPNLSLDQVIKASCLSTPDILSVRGPVLRSRIPSRISIESARMDFLVFLKWFVPRMTRDFSPMEDAKHSFMGYKGGPYGGPSFLYSPHDAYTLNLPQNENIKQALFDFVRKYHSAEFFERFSNSFNYSADLYWLLDLRSFSRRPSNRASKARPRLAKFSFLSEKGGKTRIITACNYWIQWALFKFHHDMMGLLGKIPTDYSFEQDRCFESFTDFHKRGFRRGFSFDMTGATDRFPRWCQRAVLRAFMPEIADEWDRLVSLPIYDSHTHSYHSFTVGQPMGVYSSWPVFAFTHHVVVRYCAFRCGMDPLTFLLYMLLGDDFFCCEERVAKFYHWFLTKVLDVGISRFKSIVSTKRSGLVCEFAKRNFASGPSEVSPITPLLLSTARQEDTTLIREIIERIVLRWRITAMKSTECLSVLFKTLIRAGRRNETMSWFLLPDVFPDYIPLEGRLREIYQEHWEPTFWDSEVGLARVSAIYASIDRLREEIPGMLSYTRKCYGVPTSNSHIPYNYIPPVKQSCDVRSPVIALHRDSNDHPLKTTLGNLIDASHQIESERDMERYYVKLMNLKKASSAIAFGNEFLARRMARVKLCRAIREFMPVVEDDNPFDAFFEPTDIDLPEG